MQSCKKKKLIAVGIHKVDGDKPLLGCVNYVRLVANIYNDHPEHAAADIELIWNVRADRITPASKFTKHFLSTSRVLFSLLRMASEAPCMFEKSFKSAAACMCLI